MRRGGREIERGAGVGIGGVLVDYGDGTLTSALLGEAVVLRQEFGWSWG